VLFREGVEALPSSAYLWDFDGDGEFDDTTSGPSVLHQFNEEGDFSVSLTIRYEGVADSASQNIFVNKKQEFPLADFEAKVQALSASFYGSLSLFDGSVEGNTLSYEWDFDIKKDTNGNGNPLDDIDSTEENPTYVYTSVGEKHVQLTVKNAAGKKHSVQKIISVGSAASGLSERDAIIQSVVMKSDAPMAQLHIVVRKPTSDSKLPAEIIVYGFNANGSFLSDSVNLALESGTGTITGDSEKMQNGMMRAFYVPAESQESVKLRATAKSTSGFLTETIEF
jgi:PKD repeat protein